MLSQLPQFWLDRHHADTLVDIVVACPDRTASAIPTQATITGYSVCGKDCSGLCCGSCTSESIANESNMQHVLATLPCHRVLLSAASTYFSALLSPTWSEGCQAVIKNIPVVLADAEDLPAMVALLKCIYTNDVLLTSSDLAETMQHNLAASGAAAAAVAGNTSSCSCPQALQEIQANSSSMCWQELCVRVLRLADQFSVPGVLQAAVGKLSCLFSYQLSWPAVLAVLWLPGAVAQQPLLKDLRQMAINRVTQDLKHLDVCLAQPMGRSVLQHLPPDALATLLASDQLALASENSTLAAIDVWLAGPVAGSLSTMPAMDTAAAAAATAAGGGSSEAAAAADGMHSATGSGEAAAAAATAAAGKVAAAGGAGRSQRLAAALQLLVRQVRLPLCSGAFLAAAVAQRPWLCLGMQGSHELQLMQQYYSADSHGRYQLAMHLLRGGQTCPWSVMLRRGLPSTISISSSSIHNSGSSSSGTGSIMKGPGMYTGLSQIRALLEGTAAGGSFTGSSAAKGLGDAGGSSGSGAAAEQQQFGAGRGITLDERVMGGYCWQLSLVAVQVSDSSSIASSSYSTSDSTTVCAKCNSTATETKSGSCSPAGRPGHTKQQRLCLSICCRPAWANVIDEENSPEYDATAVHCFAAAATRQVLSAEGAPIAACGAVLCGGGAVAADAEGDTDGRCSTCDALWTIAGAKAAEAIARHAPLQAVPQHHFHQHPAGYHHKPDGGAPAALRCSCSSNSTGAAAGGECDPMVLCEEAVAADGASGSSRSSATETRDSCSAVEVPGYNIRCWLVHISGHPLPICRHQQGKQHNKAAGRLVHLDVVVGIQLVAASSREQLQQLVGDGTSGAGNQSPALTHMPCLLLWDAAAGAAHGLVPVDVSGIGSSNNCLAGAGARGARAGGGGVEGGIGSGSAGVLRGWQPELWSGLAPSGSLFWYSSLRPLMD